MGFPTNSGLLILEAGDSCGDEVASAADVTGDGCGREDRLLAWARCAGQLGGPGPPNSPPGHTVMGPVVPSVSDNVGIPEAPQVAPRGLVMVSGASLSGVLNLTRGRRAGPTPSTNHTEI